jgi:hypothetical protein
MTKTTKTPSRYVIGRIADHGREYWTGTAWATDVAAARTYRTMQAVDKAKVKNDGRTLFATDAPEVTQ